VVAKLIEILLLPSSSQNVEVGQQDEASSAVVEDLAALRELHSFCASCATGKRRANEKLVCAHNFHDTRQKCLSGKCESCGFKALWMPVRQTVVFEVPAGKLRPGVSEVWTTEMIWDNIKTGGDGSKSEDDLRQQHSGTVIAFLDKSMQAYSNFVPHSFHMQQSKTADCECYENTVPGMIRDKTDWSENGECKVRCSQSCDESIGQLCITLFLLQFHPFLSQASGKIEPLLSRREMRSLWNLMTTLVRATWV
jgi:hypothetical protein